MPEPIAINVVVVFYSRYGATEKLALAAGVGALQARANIRLRRLHDLTQPDLIERDAPWKENMVRFSADYIAPREVDAEWADLLVLAAPEDEKFQEMCGYLQSLKNMHGKIAAVLTRSRAILGDAALAGFTVVPAPKEKFDAGEFGKRVCEMVRAIKDAADQASSQGAGIGVPS